MTTQYAVIYRTGGTERFKWHRVLEDYADYDRALNCKEELARMGYEALIHNKRWLDSIGLPETFGPGHELDGRYLA
jgi:hypothetical protein